MEGGREEIGEGGRKEESKREDDMREETREEDENMGERK